MSKRDWTPGPWEAEDGGGKGSWIKGANGEWTALACGTDDGKAEANARLIAAAPKLCEALSLLLEEVELSGNATSEDYGWPKAVKAARGALAEAFGKAVRQ